MVKVAFYHTRFTRWLLRKILVARLANLGALLAGAEAEHRRALCGRSWSYQSDRPIFFRTYYERQIDDLNKEIGALQSTQAQVQSQLLELSP